MAYTHDIPIEDSSRARRRRKALEALEVKALPKIGDLRFDPNAEDGDGDGMVQDNTPFERPAVPSSITRALASVTGDNRSSLRGSDIKYLSNKELADRAVPDNIEELKTAIRVSNAATGSPMSTSDLDKHLNSSDDLLNLSTADFSPESVEKLRASLTRAFDQSPEWRESVNQFGMPPVWSADLDGAYGMSYMSVGITVNKNSIDVERGSLTDKRKKLTGSLPLVKRTAANITSITHNSPKFKKTDKLYVGNSTEAVLTHEWGHYLSYLALSTSSDPQVRSDASVLMMDSWSESIFLDRITEGVSPEVESMVKYFHGLLDDSGMSTSEFFDKPSDDIPFVDTLYGTVNPAEFFAEAVSAYFSPDKKENKALNTGSRRVVENMLGLNKPDSKIERKPAGLASRQVSRKPDGTREFRGAWSPLNGSDWLKDATPEEIAEVLVPYSREDAIVLTLQNISYGMMPADANETRQLKAWIGFLLDAGYEGVTVWDYSPSARQTMKDIITKAIAESPGYEFMLRTYGSPPFLSTNPNARSLLRQAGIPEVPDPSSQTLGWGMFHTSQGKLTLAASLGNMFIGFNFGNPSIAADLPNGVPMGNTVIGKPSITGPSGQAAPMEYARNFSLSRVDTMLHEYAHWFWSYHLGSPYMYGAKNASNFPDLGRDRQDRAEFISRATGETAPNVMTRMNMLKNTFDSSRNIISSSSKENAELGVKLGYLQKDPRTGSYSPVTGHPDAATIKPDGTIFRGAPIWQAIVGRILSEQVTNEQRWSPQDTWDTAQDLAEAQDKIDLTNYAQFPLPRLAGGYANQSAQELFAESFAVFLSGNQQSWIKYSTPSIIKALSEALNIPISNGELNPQWDTSRRGLSSRSTSVFGKSFDEVAEEIKLTPEEILIAEDDFGSRVEEITSGQIEKRPFHSLIEKDKKRILDSIRIEVGDDGIPMIMADPNPLFFQHIPDKRDWSKVRLPSFETIRKAVEYLEKRQDPSVQMSGDTEAFNAVVKRFFDALVGLIEEMSEGSQQDIGEEVGDGWLSLYLGGLSKPESTLVLQGSPDQVHDAFGHVGIGRGFDRHGEWANPLAVISMIDNPIFNDLTKQEKGYIATFIMNEYAITRISFAYSSRPSEISEDAKKIGDLLWDYNGDIFEFIDIIDDSDKTQVLNNDGSRRQGLASTSSKPLNEITKTQISEIAKQDVTHRKSILSNVSSTRTPSVASQTNPPTSTTLNRTNSDLPKKAKARFDQQIESIRKQVEELEEANKRLNLAVEELKATGSWQGEKYSIRVNEEGDSPPRTYTREQVEEIAKGDGQSFEEFVNAIVGDAGASEERRKNSIDELNREIKNLEDKKKFVSENRGENSFHIEELLSDSAVAEELRTRSSEIRQMSTRERQEKYTDGEYIYVVHWGAANLQGGVLDPSRSRGEVGKGITGNTRQINDETARYMVSLRDNARRDKSIIEEMKRQIEDGQPIDFRKIGQNDPSDPLRAGRARHLVGASRDAESFDVTQQRLDALISDRNDTLSRLDRVADRLIEDDYQYSSTYRASALQDLFSSYGGRYAEEGSEDWGDNRAKSNSTGIHVFKVKLGEDATEENSVGETHLVGKHTPIASLVADNDPDPSNPASETWQGWMDMVIEKDKEARRNSIESQEVAEDMLESLETRTVRGKTMQWVDMSTKSFIDNAPSFDIKSLNYTKPELRKRLKDRIMAGDKGGKPGQWSARKAQLLAIEYRKAGGGYRGAPRKTQRSLKKWTREKWRTSDGKDAIREGGTRRYLPASAWQKLTPAQRAATNRKKTIGSRRGNQFVANTEQAQRASRNARKR